MPKIRLKRAIKQERKGLSPGQGGGSGPFAAPSASLTNPESPDSLAVQPQVSAASSAQEQINDEVENFYAVQSRDQVEKERKLMEDREKEVAKN